MMKVKYYKCPECSKKFKTLSGWGSHIDTIHPGIRPNDYSISRYFYYTVTGRTHGTCRTCKGNTPWNENSMKYDQYCTNPECKKAYVKIAKERMIKTYGKEHLLNDPDIQKKMLSNRSITKKYRYSDGIIFEYTGNYEKNFLTMLDIMMDWDSNDIIAPSPNVYYYDYKNPKDKENEGKKFYMPDFYIPSLNLEIEIKQQTNGNQKFNDINKVKERLKDEVMMKNPKVNYLKINDNNFEPFFEFVMKYKEMIPSDKELNAMESFIDNNTILENIEYSDIATEGMLDYVKTDDLFKLATLVPWKSIGRCVKNATGSINPFSKASVKIEDNDIIIKGINYKLLKNRISSYYDDKSIFNIFLPRYNTLSYRAYERKKIQRCEIKIDYIHTKEFYALELVTMFTELGRRFRDSSYLGIANMIYKESWLSQSDKNAEITPSLSTNRLTNLKLTLNSYQKEFIEKYPKLKAQLNLNGYILAFEQGLGKTLTAIALSECLEVDHLYIVCPNSLKENWALEIQKYYEKYSDDDLWKQEVFICGNRTMLFNKNTTKFIITNNESIEKMFPYVMGGKNMLILDESHNFRNLKSKRVEQLIALRDKLNCTDSLIMSGTPIKATPDEIIPALMMIDPTFDTETATLFSKAFKLQSSLGTSIVQARFGKIIYRKEKDDVLENQLPQKIVKTLPMKISNGNKYVMNNVVSLVFSKFNTIYDEGYSDMKELKQPFYEMSYKFKPVDYDFDKFKELMNDMVSRDKYLHEVDQEYIESYMKLAKIKMTSKQDKDQYDFYIKNYVRYKAHCLGLAFGQILPPYRRDMFIDLYTQNSSYFYDKIKNHTKKTLIFTQFKGVANYIYKDLNDNGIGTVMITGDVANRLEILKEFKENNSIQVLVATSQTLGTGVTLVEASQMFFFGPPWRQSDFDQCSDRIHRIGQTDDCYIYTVTLDTGDELNLSTRMDNILAWSKKMTESVIHTTKDTDNVDETNFEELLVASESSTEIVDEFLSLKEDNQLRSGNEISKYTLDKIITLKTNYNYIEAIVNVDIPKDTILEKDSIRTPLDITLTAIERGKYRNMIFSQLANAINCRSDKNGNVEYLYEKDSMEFEHWHIITKRDIKSGETLELNTSKLPEFMEKTRFIF